MRHNGLLFVLPSSIALPGESFALTKGADSHVVALCEAVPEPLRLDAALLDFSRMGLRTLVFASRSLPDWESWAH